MLSVTPVVAGRPSITAAAFAKFAELVRKTGTSPSPSGRKRKNAARKRLNRIITEQRRYAKSAGLRAVALTLTYRNSDKYSQKHISRFVDRLRSVLKRLGYTLPYAWRLERAGQLHYHLMLWLPRTFMLDPAKLSRWWHWGSTWVEGCRSVKAWGRYMAKFDSVAKLPERARSFGSGGLDDAGNTAVSRAALPCWLLAVLPSGHRVRRCLGGGWVNVLTGEIYLSPYVWTPWGCRLATLSSPPTYH